MLLFLLFLLGDLTPVASWEMPNVTVDAKDGTSHTVIADAFDSAIQIRMKDGELSHGTFVIYGQDRIWAVRFDPAQASVKVEDVTLDSAGRTANIHKAYSAARGTDGATIIFSADETYAMNEQGDRTEQWKFSYNEHVDWAIQYQDREGNPQSYKPLNGRNVLPAYVAPGTFLSLHIATDFEGQTEVAETCYWRLWRNGTIQVLTEPLALTNAAYREYRTKNASIDDVVDSWSTAWLPRDIRMLVLPDRMALTPDRKHMYLLDSSTGEVKHAATTSPNWKVLGKLSRVYTLPLTPLEVRQARVAQSFTRRNVPGAKSFVNGEVLQRALDVVKMENRAVLVKPEAAQVTGGRSPLYTYAYTLKSDPSGNMITLNYSANGSVIYLDAYSPTLKFLGHHTLDMPGLGEPSTYTSHTSVMSWVRVGDRSYLAVMQSEYAGDLGDFPRYTLFEWPY